MKRLSSTVIGITVLVAAMGCSYDRRSSTSKKELGYEASSNQCPSSPTLLTGATASGGNCSGYASCAPVCCGCPDSDGSYLAAACLDGVCADEETTCAALLPKAIAAEICTGTVVEDLKSSSKSDMAKPADLSDPNTSSNCVAGTSGSCYGSGLTWTGSECCLSFDAECASGTSGSCYGTGMHWTGSVCCVEGVTQCVAGTSGSCYGTGLHWTGSKCCIDYSAKCVDGTSGSCYGTNLNWTGSQCCVEGVSSCVSGTSSSCYGSGLYWTGSLCCS